MGIHERTDGKIGVKGKETDMQYEGWEGFISGKWSEGEVNVRDFIQRNYTPYEGDEAFLAPPTEATKKLWQMVLSFWRCCWWVPSTASTW